MQSTPPDAIESIFDLLPGGGLFFDLGCGDGRLLEAAHARGYRAIGVELDTKRAASTRRRLAGKAAVIAGDVRQVNTSHADVVYFWLYPDLIASLDLPATATIISYRHKFRGSRRRVIDGHTFYIRRATK